MSKMSYFPLGAPGYVSQSARRCVIRPSERGAAFILFSAGGRDPPYEKII